MRMSKWILIGTDGLPDCGFPYDFKIDGIEGLVHGHVLSLDTHGVAVLELKDHIGVYHMDIPFRYRRMWYRIANGEMMGVGT